MDIDLSQIYIVRPEMMIRPALKKNDDYPNFVMSASARSAETVGAVAGPITAFAVGSSLISLPAALLIGAITGGGLLAAKISKDKSALQSPIDDAEKKEIQAFLLSHGLTIDMAKELGFVFPPGHPRVDMLYKRHPLADVSNSGKENSYIPHDKYDEILMAEREAELLKMLVHLGATKITISHDIGDANRVEMKGAVSGTAAAAGSAEVQGSRSTREESSFTDKRVFRLSGKKWRSGDKLDRSVFSWVSFEPSWEALVIAREVGGCMSAALDIRENTSFSTNKSAAAKLAYMAYSGAASVGMEKHATHEKVYFVEAEFGEIEVNPA